MIKNIIITLSLFFSFSALAEDASLEPILVSSSELPDLSKKELRKYLSGQIPTWPNQEPVVLLLYPSNSELMLWLCNDLIGMPEPTYRRFIIEKSFRSGFKLIEVEDEEAALRALSTTPGAIAPIWSHHQSAELHPVQTKN